MTRRSFHWYTPKDRDRQLIRYMEDTFSLPEEEIRHAIAQADAAQAQFHEELFAAGDAVL